MSVKVKIGLEIHAYLNTKSKLFCACSTKISNEIPNSSCCPVCLGHPGSKPVLNESAVEKAIKVGFALKCKINKDFFFSRKTYFYPDSASNYQITQYEVPIAENGYLKIGNKKIGIKRAHLEIDPAALIHPKGMGKSSYVLIDYNRSGLPLIEIVTSPDLSSPEEAREFLNQLENILSYLDVLMDNTTLKVDCNISIDGGERVEIKNVSGFAAAQKALEFEIARQIKQKEIGQKIVQHTRAFDAENNKTIELRTKETEEDYGYIFDPDLVKISIEEDELDRIKESVPELPQEKIKRFISEFGLSEYDAKVLCSNLVLGNIFEELVKKGANPKISSNILSREILSILNHDSLEIKDVSLNVDKLFELIDLINKKKVSDKNAKLSLINYISGDKNPPKKYLEENNLLISENIDINSIVAAVIENNKTAVNDYKNGNKKVINFLAGQIMRQTKGSVKIDEVIKILQEKLN